MSKDRKSSTHELLVNEKGFHATTPESLQYGLSVAHGLIKKLYAALPEDQRPQLMQNLLTGEQVFLESTIGIQEWDPISLDAVVGNIRVNGYVSGFEARSRQQLKKSPF